MERWLRTQGVMDCPHVREGSPGPPTDGTQCHSHAELRTYRTTRAGARGPQLADDRDHCLFGHGSGLGVVRPPGSEGWPGSEVAGCAPPFSRWGAVS